MKRFVDPAPQFFNGGIMLSGGKVNFYENGSTTTRKNTYNANNGSINTNPVVLSDEGRLPPCWGEGLYTVVVTDADGVQVWHRNDVEFGSDDGQFSDWSAVRNYAQSETVRYTDGNYYISESNNNIGNAPDVATTKWSKIAFIEYWNEDKPGGYAEDAIAIKDGYLYRSLSDDNEFDPSVTGWENLTFNNNISGTLTVTEGVKVGNSSVVAVDVLDYYLEGTFTPVIHGTSTVGSGTYVTQSGKYTRVGNVVFFTLRLEWSAHTGTGNMRVAGMPLTSSANSCAIIPSFSSLNIGGSTYQFIPTMSGSVNYIDLQRSILDGSAPISGVPMDTAGLLDLTGFYFV